MSAAIMHKCTVMQFTCTLIAPRHGLLGAGNNGPGKKGPSDYLDS